MIQNFSRYDRLNKAQQLQWVADYDESNKIYNLIKENIETNKLLVDRFTLNEIDYLKEQQDKVKNDDSIKNLVQTVENLSVSSSNPNSAFVRFFDDNASYLFIRKNLFYYETRAVMKSDFIWNMSLEGQMSIEDFEISIVLNSHSEIEVLFENPIVFGKLHFSSLGVIEGEFFERESLEGKPRGKTCLLITKSLVDLVYIVK
ncbi:hypothetical protein ACFFHM_20700 [Halalkalibacter kiskunsagensis]|uniref:Uncharacterized protein n=1 Tax=Halalkalibacter kiskunsagensis TaxID=1548599 RepID=A0ABV6KHP6_9BACI